MNIELFVDDEDNPKSYIFFRDEEGNKLPPGKWEGTDDDGWVCKLDMVPRSMLRAAFSQIEELKKSNEDLKSLRAQQAREIAELERRNNELQETVDHLHIEIADLKAERDGLLNRNSELHGEIERLKVKLTEKHVVHKEVELELTQPLSKDTLAVLLTGSPTLSMLQKQIHETAVEHGWWEPQEVKPAASPSSMHNFNVLMHRTFGDLVALMHSELSEALEAFRERGLEKWNQHDEFCTAQHKLPEHESKFCTCENGPKPEGAFVELADCIIRILDTAEFYGVNMEEVILEKMAYNESRPYRHGGKKL